MKIKNAGHYTIEKQANVWLAATPAEQRPETSWRTHIVSVAYQAAGYYEATDANGRVESVHRDAVTAWMRQD